MMTLTALMMGWGVFWLCLWLLFTGVMLLPPIRAEHVKRIGHGLVLAMLAFSWIVAWALVRSLAA